MGGPFEIGDVVVCVDVAPRPYARHGITSVRLGRVYRVAACAKVDGPNEQGLWAVQLHGVIVRDTNTGWLGCSRFRKLDEDIGFDFREQLRAKPKEPVRAEQPLGTSAGGSAPPFSAPASQHSSTPGVV